MQFSKDLSTCRTPFAVHFFFCFLISHRVVAYVFHSIMLVSLFSRETLITLPNYAWQKLVSGKYTLRLRHPHASLN